MNECIYCHDEPGRVAFTILDGRSVCAPCWEARPGVDATGERYATHKTVERYLLTTAGYWWVFPEPEPGKASMQAIACVTLPPVGNCRHCGCQVAPDQLLAESVIEGTPLLWLSTHCWRCYDADPRCPETCTFIDVKELQRSLVHA